MRTRRVVAVAVPLFVAAFAGVGRAQDPKDAVIRALEARAERYDEVARRIWSLAEVGYQEVESSALLQAELREAGFEVEPGVAGIPTAFVASHGEGRPVIAFLAEFDALPGLSQDSVAERRPVAGQVAGHACGHHLFGTASVAAAVAIREWLASSGRSGTIRVYGTPAEEGGAGKVYMVRAGLFDDVDVVLDWHPGDRNDAGPATMLANISAKFRFRGVSAHAAASPDRGRSALDGVEAMNHMVNLLREHVPQETRIHYVITDGGRAPNVVPDRAEVYTYVRHPDARVVQEVFDRVVKAAEGAALGTGTTVEHEVIGGTYGRLPNETLARLVDANLRRIGGVRYSAAERAFAERIRATLGDLAPEPGAEAEVVPYALHATSASSDAGDVSWAAPAASFTTATWVPGTAAHSWQAVAAGGTSIGRKGMRVAAKTLATTAVDLYLDPALVRSAREELDRRRGPGFRYRPLLGDRPPALDYRR